MAGPGTMSCTALCLQDCESSRWRVCMSSGIASIVCIAFHRAITATGTTTDISKRITDAPARVTATGAAGDITGTRKQERGALLLINYELIFFSVGYQLTINQ